METERTSPVGSGRAAAEPPQLAALRRGQPAESSPSLAGSAGEVLGSSSLRFLAATALRRGKEEEKKGKEQQVANVKQMVEKQWSVAGGTFSSAVLPVRPAAARQALTPELQALTAASVRELQEKKEGGRKRKKKKKKRRIRMGSTPSRCLGVA